jgi:hypothetical protein
VGVAVLDAYQARVWSSRADIAALFAPGRERVSPLAPALVVLRRRSERLAPVLTALEAAEQSGRLTQALPELAPSYLHLHANRLLRAGQRAQELVLYDSHHRAYESRIARSLATAVGRQPHHA